MYKIHYCWSFIASNFTRIFIFFEKFKNFFCRVIQKYVCFGWKSIPATNVSASQFFQKRVCIFLSVVSLSKRVFNDVSFLWTSGTQNQSQNQILFFSREYFLLTIEIFFFRIFKNFTRVFSFFAWKFFFLIKFQNPIRAFY